MRDPHTSEKERRSMLKARSLKLSELRLPTTLELITDFYKQARDFDVIAEEGDGLAVYKDVTDHGRGTRVEIGFVRLFRFNPANENDSWCPALRLRLRLCFKLDMDVIKFVMPEPTWSFDCWSLEELDQFIELLQKTTGYSALRDKVPSEVNIAIEETSYRHNTYRVAPEAKQMWWGNVDVT